jgi:hypothetical protein
LAADLRHRLSLGGRTVLPMLAVNRAGSRHVGADSVAREPLAGTAVTAAMTELQIAALGTPGFGPPLSRASTLGLSPCAVQCPRCPGGCLRHASARNMVMNYVDLRIA